MIHIVLVDDQTIIRQGLKSLLESQPDFQIVGEAENGKVAIALIEKLYNTPQQPDLILMDVRMPIMDGVAAIKKLTQQFDNICILVLSTFDDDEYITQAMQFGAKGYLLKDTPIEEIALAIKAAIKGYTQLGPGLFQKFITHSDRLELNSANILPKALQTLTPREKEVLALIAKGASNKEIAQELYISDQTVGVHRKNIMKKLNVSSTASLIKMAHDFGIVAT